MRSIVIIGKGVYADSLRQTLGLFFQTVQVPVRVRNGEYDVVIQDHLLPLQKATTLILCCDASLSVQELLHWVRRLRGENNFIVAEIVVLVQDEYRVSAYLNAPVLFDRRNRFTLDRIPGHRVFRYDIPIGNLLSVCWKFTEIYPGEWSRLLHNSSLGKVRSLYDQCESTLKNGTGRKRFEEASKELARILACSQDLSWPQLLCLDPHQQPPPYPEKFMRIQKKMDAMLTEHTSEFEALWTLIKELLSYIKEETIP